MRNSILFAALSACALVCTLTACDSQSELAPQVSQSADSYALEEAVPAGPTPKDYKGTEAPKKQ